MIQPRPRPIGRPWNKGWAKSVRLEALAFGTGDGYGNSSEQIALAFDRAGLHVTVNRDIVECGEKNAQRIFDRPADEGDVVLIYSQPWGWPSRESGPLTVGMTMYESDAIPDSWELGFKSVHEIWTPCQWNADIFRSLAGDVPVHVIHLGVNPDDFGYERRSRGDRLRFLHFSTVGTEYRKGADLAVLAFQTAFPNRPDVSLTLHANYSPFNGFSDPRIRNSGHPLRTHELANLYRQFDCLIYPSRGEGFGLIPLEAMSTGLPAIFMAETGMREYAQLGLDVPGKQTPARVGEGRLEQIHSHGNWYEPNLEALVARMREVDQNYQSVTDKAAASAAEIRQRWTWDTTAQAMIERFDGA